MRNNKRVPSIITILILIFTFSGCSSSEDELQVTINELQNENSVLNEQLSKLEVKAEQIGEEKDELDKTLRSVKDEVESLKNNQQTSKKYDEQSIQIMNYFEEYNGRIYSSDFHPNEKMAILNSEEGLRILPDKNAPFFGQDEITYEPRPIEGSLVMVHAYFNGNPGDPGGAWAFITNGYISSGYVNTSDLEPYEYIKSYKPSEQFRDFKIGMNAQNVFDHFNNKVELIKVENRYGYVIRVNSDEDKNYQYIDFWYHVADNRVSVINTNSHKYPLESGFKVGDKAEDVFAHYDELYPQSEYFNSETFRRYDIGDGYSLDFRIDDGLVVFIMINGGMYSYA